MMVKRARAKLADSTDFQQLAELLDISDQSRPENKLAFVGDKRLFYGPKNSTGHQAALAYAQIGRSRIAMGLPIGPKSSWIPAIEAFRADTTQSGFRPVIYAVPPDLILLALGLMGRR